MSDLPSHVPESTTKGGTLSLRQCARYRIRFSKLGTLRYIAHLDLARLWERLLRRAGLPLIYSRGFNPRPQMQFAAALPLGCESTCEVLDIWLEEEVPPEHLPARLQEAAPAGLTIESVVPVALDSPALQTLTHSATYLVVAGEGLTSEGLTSEGLTSEGLSREELQDRIEMLLTQSEIYRERRGRRYNLRPLIHHVEVLPDGPPALLIRLSLSQEHGTGRPDEVLDALGLDPLAARVTRTNITLIEPKL